MARICGPILGFRGRDNDNWRLAIMVAHQGGTASGALTFAETGQQAAPAVSAAPLGEVGGAQFFGYEFTAPMNGNERTFEYGFAGEDARWRFVVPGREQPLRIGYTSCNGFSIPGDMKRIADKNAVWRDLVATHARQAMHMLLMGGDQNLRRPALGRRAGIARVQRAAARAAGDDERRAKPSR